MDDVKSMGYMWGELEKKAKDRRRIVDGLCSQRSEGVK
jgi:hypothetical protein